MTYRAKTPWILSKLLYSRLMWKMPQEASPCIYLTFDDGPHPTVTPFVLQTLKQYHAKATFFCIGKNVQQYPTVYNEVIEQGHTVGNHTHNHLNGWHTCKQEYIKNIEQAAEHIDSLLFRPPYGRIKRGQINSLINREQPYRVYMWDVLSGDFDTGITPQQCVDNVLNNIEPGSIVVFHDSQKAWERMNYALPKVLEYCANKNWTFKAIPK